MQSDHLIRKVSFIGSGNVAYGLAPSLKKIGIEIVEVFSAHAENTVLFAKNFGARPVENLSDLGKASDLYLITIPDREIENVVKNFPAVEGIVAHTSGIMPIDVLKKFSKYGVFYPLQTFSKGFETELAKVPFCIEASSTPIERELFDVASKLSSHVQVIDSEQRKRLHLSAVLVNNFTNLMYTHAEEFLNKNHLDFHLLIPLMEETVRKAKLLKPANSQTGPAKRNDIAAIEEHMKMLEDYPDIQNLYNQFSELIRKRYHE